MTIMEVEIDIMDRLDTATFDELTATVSGAIESATRHAAAAIDELVVAGGALLAMRDRMPGQYHGWLQEQGMTINWAARCVRLYVYRDHLPTQRQSLTMTQAMGALSTLPALVVAPRKHSDDQIAKAKELVQAGATKTEAARLTGISLPRLIGLLATPAEQAAAVKANNAKHRAKRAEQRALAAQKMREERDALAKANGKELSVAYAAIRQALAALARADRGTHGQHSDRASSYLTAAESAVVAAMQADRAS